MREDPGRLFETQFLSLSSLSNQASPKYYHLECKFSEMPRYWSPELQACFSVFCISTVHFDVVDSQFSEQVNDNDVGLTSKNIYLFTIIRTQIIFTSYWYSCQSQHFLQDTWSSQSWISQTSKSLLPHQDDQQWWQFTLECFITGEIWCSLTLRYLR